jgi:hypothetical protein
VCSSASRAEVLKPAASGFANRSHALPGLRVFAGGVAAIALRENLRAGRVIARDRAIARRVMVLRSGTIDSNPATILSEAVRSWMTAHPEVTDLRCQVRDVSRLGARLGHSSAVRADHSENNARPRVRITAPTGWQKFETCPVWGAKLFPSERQRPVG